MRQKVFAGPSLGYTIYTHLLTEVGKGGERERETETETERQRETERERERETDRQTDRQLVS